jgi:serine/threonine protein phosphatase PrpC
VADGMGGHAAGDVASQMIVSSLKKVHEGIELNRMINDIEDRLIEVNKRLIEKANQTTKRTTIGSTVVVMVAYRKYCIYIWAGDSRLYRLRDMVLRQMTTDHSQVELYVEKGLISREEAAVHPHGNMITRAVGATDELFLDMDIQEMHGKDRYLLCSDGLTKHITDFEIQDILGEGTNKESCETLIDLTLERGAGDNVTVIVVDIE